MHSAICSWASAELYAGRLVAHGSVEGHTLEQLPHVSSTDDTCAPLLLIDTAGCDCAEDEADPTTAALPRGKGAAAAASVAQSELSASKSNRSEARVVARHVRSLLASGLKHDEIGVITPYNAQVPSPRRPRVAATASSAPPTAPCAARGRWSF